MKKALSALVLAMSMTTNVLAENKDSRLYEMRVYYAHPGKLEALNQRFRDHTCKLFEKHGMTNVGYWEPLENPKNKLVYVLSYPGQKERDASWKAFGSDEEWKRAHAESEKNGPLVKSSEKFFLQATDYSPVIKNSIMGNRVFELRTYTASKGNLEHLHARFRDHTCKLFEKHGMTNVGYWSMTAGQKGADATLIYILAHKTKEAGLASFAAFRKDSAWIEARKASEEKAGGSLTIKDGVLSEYMKATDYSPIQ